MKHGDKVKNKILDAGLKLWRTEPRSVTVNQVAAAIGMTHQAVRYHFTDYNLRDAIARHAVEKGDSYVIVQLMAMKHAAVRLLTAEERRRHAAIIAG